MFNVFQIVQHQAVKYEHIPLSPLSKHRISVVRRKVLVLDLDETLIHSHHDGVQRYGKEIITLILINLMGRT